MAMKYSTVKCTASSNSSAFVIGKNYRMCHAAHDDVIESRTGLSFGITAQLNHDSEHGKYSFELIGNYNGQ